MLKFSRRNKRLVIPAGINPNYGLDSSAMYNTSDATIVANDVIAGKIGYGADGKIVGTLDIESRVQESYQEGYEFGYNEGNNAGYILGESEGFDNGVNAQKAKLVAVTITENGSYNREDGYDEVIVDVPDLNGSYNEGVDDGIEIGKTEIIEGMSDATITPSTVFKGEIGYGKDGERIEGDYEFVEGFDFGKIGYDQAFSNEVNRPIANAIAYSKQLYDEWDPNTTSAQSHFSHNDTLVFAPNVNCSNIVNGCQNMFYDCSNLTTVPALNTSNCQYFGNMFYYCTNLTNVGLIDTSSAKSLDSMFYYCNKLTSAPALNTSNVTNMGNMFGYCTRLISVPEYDASNVKSVISMFYYYASSSFATTDLGGFINLGKNFSDLNGEENHLNLTTMHKLTYQSCMNVINKVYDMNLTNVTNARISFNSTPKALLSDDDIAIATSKGWTIA